MAPSSAARRTTAIAAQLAPPRPLEVCAAAAAAAGPRSAAVPSGFELVPGEDDKEVAAHLRWLQQKDALGQDALLLGPPGALRRHLALRFCELQGREAEVLTVTRDTTEADLKQRRELTTGPAGTQTVYADGAPVRCAILGRILILDGLEKAERNVLPTLNNLLENREMSLDDGRFLIAARRFDALPPGTADDAGGTADAGGRSRLVRVHENFRVIALALPCPPCIGNPLDPPLRSRFQARVIAPPILASPAQLGSLGSSTPEVLLRRLAALQRALNSLSLGGEAEAEALMAALPPGARPPVLAHDALLRIVRLISGAGVLPPAVRPSVAEALQRAYPLELLAAASSGMGSSGALKEAAGQWLKHFQLESEGGSSDWPAFAVVSAKATVGASGEGAVVLDFGAGAAPVPLASPALPAPPATGFVESPALRRLAAALAQDFAVGHDCLLVGPPGCGKSALARRVAALLGHGAPGGRGLEFFFLYEEMSSRDLLQRRTTDAQGRTSWIDSPLVRAARTGALCVLDGTHRLRGDVLCALAPLLQDRQALLAAANDARSAGAEVLLRADRYAAIAGQLEDSGSYDPVSNSRVARVHPAFRVLALAEPPTGRLPWLSDELSTCFSHHVYPEAGPADLVATLVELCPTLPRATAERLVAALAAAPAAENAATGAAPSAPPVPLRVLIRVARRAAAVREGGDVDGELLAGILQQALFPFLPRGERAELLARLGKHFDPKDVKAAAAQALRHGESKRKAARPSAEEAAPEAPASPEAGAGAGGPKTVRFGSFLAPVGCPKRPELVPSVDFVDIGRHMELLEELARALFERGERHLLLLGPQGVGKNRVVDRLLQALALEREYMQLHRDTTVAQLTVTPSVADGRLLYEDSPLIRAAQHGRVLVLDEADKAPLEVVVVLKSLVEDGQLALPDGRRLARFAAEAVAGGEEVVAGGPTVVPIHPAFRMLVLANRPGFPFLGNDLIREADVFSVFCLDNPDAASELQLVRAVGPNVPEALLRTLVGIFADLRLAVEEGRLQYPYSTRELLAVVRHLDKFPDEPLEQALASILAFDRFDPAVRETLRPIFEKRGVPIAAALGAPMDGEDKPELQQPWLRALAALRNVRLAATERLKVPLPAGTWRTAPSVDLPVQLHAAEARPAIFDPPQTVQLAGLAFDRIQDGFSESVVRARLPLNLRSGPVIDAVSAVTDDVGEMSGGGAAKTLHMLSTMPLAIWTIEDPLAVGAHAGRCAVLPVGPGSDWALLGERGAGAVTVNGRIVTLGTPQLAWVPGAAGLLLHMPLDLLAPQLFVERPHREDVRAEVLAVPPLAGSRSAGRVRPKVEDSFVAVPCASWEPRMGQEGDGSANDVEFHSEDTIVFFQPSGRRLVQLDVVRQQAREVSLESLLADSSRSQGGLLGRLRGSASATPPSFSITATATLRGIEVLISESPPPDLGSQEPSRFVAVLFPEAPGRAPTARRVDAATVAASAASAPLPAAACAGLFSTPFGSEAPVGFAAQAPAAGLAHIMEGGRADDGAFRVSALLEREGAAARARRRAPPAAPPSLAELAKADDKMLSKMLMTPGPALPVPRGDCRSTDLAVPGPLGLITRVLEQPDSHSDWIEAVHPASRTARRLQARAPADTDADVGGGPKAGVARVVPWPLSAEGSSGQAPDSCVVFRDGAVRWLELHPEGLQRSLQEYLEVRGLRSLMEQAKRRTGGGSPQEMGEQQEDEEELEDEDEEDDEEEVEEVEEGEEGEEGEEVEEVEEGEEGERQQERGGDEAGGRRVVRRARVTRRRRGGGAAGQRRRRRGGGGAGEPQEDGGPERVRRDTLRQAKRQRREILEAQRREEKRRQEAREASGKPKHGDEDDEEHVGGNRWAGGSGGADTAGLGGKGGPYRLEKKGQNVHQISDDAKAQISEEAKEAARKMGEEARQKRLKEIEMGGGDYDLYMTILGEVQGEIEQLRRVLGAAAARQRERVWHRGIEGELDENRLVDAIAGESAVFKRRAEREARPGEVLMQPKRITFLFDTSASMYRFNGMDGRLRRSCETAVMLMEALRGFEQKFDYEICCHDGDHVHLELVPFGHPPEDEKERLKVISKMLASAQYCSSGDNTLPAIERACERVATSGPADDYFVFAFSDANFARYGLTAEALGRTLGRHRTVHAVCFFIATFEDEALALSRQMPDQVKVCLDLKALPAELRQQFVSSVARGGRAAL